MAKLSPKQEQFAREYLIDLNATAAARRAGYKDPNIGRQLITKNNVSSRLQELMDARAERTEITADKVLKELALIGFSNMADYVEWNGEGVTFKASADLTREQTAVVLEVKSRKRTRVERDSGESVADIEDVELSFKLHDKKGALVDIGKHLGMFIERKDITSGGEPLLGFEIVMADDADDDT